MKKALIALMSISFILAACSTAQEKREHEQRVAAQKDASQQSMQEMNQEISKTNQ